MYLCPCWCVQPAYFKEIVAPWPTGTRHSNIFPTPKTPAKKNLGRSLNKPERREMFFLTKETQYCLSYLMSINLEEDNLYFYNREGTAAYLSTHCIREGAGLCTSPHLGSNSAICTSSQGSLGRLLPLLAGTAFQPSSDSLDHRLSSFFYSASKTKK
jgi:hypothetical protein